MSKCCKNCKFMYRIKDTKYCGKARAVNQYCSTANPLGKCKKYEEVENEIN